MPKHPLPKTHRLLFFISVLIFFGVLELQIFEVKYQDRFYPGVFINGESVGGKNYAETLAYFKERAQKLEGDGLHVNFESSKGVRKIKIPTSTTGLTPDNSVEYFMLGDWEAELQKAYEWGHEEDFLQRSQDQIVLIFKKKNFNFPSVMQREAVDSLLEDNFYVLFKKSVPSRFSFFENKVSVLKEVVGENIDRGEVINVLEEKLARLDTTPANFVTHADVPEITEAKLTPFLNFADRFAKETNLVFQYQRHEWKIKGSRLVTWLTIRKDGLIGIDNIKLEDYLSNMVAKFIDNPPRNSRFEMRSGELVEIASGRKGFVVDINKILQKTEEIILKINFTPEYSTIYMPIEIVEVEPKVTKETVEKYRIKDLVGEVRTSFAGSSADREHNIKIGVAAINGMLIAPGAGFSTVASIGKVTEKEGYVKELVIKENKTTKEYGGGLCQVATTLFRLALNAGLPVTERVNHRFTVPYYNPPGLDATIYGPHPDLRFVNDMNNFLLLQARVEKKEVVMELYGQKDGRISEVSKALIYDKIPAPETKYAQSAEIPIGEVKCFETPHDGVTTDVLYTVKYSDGILKEKNFHSVYQPWQKVCLIGTALPGSQPSTIE